MASARASAFFKNVIKILILFILVLDNLVFDVIFVRVI